MKKTSRSTSTKKTKVVAKKTKVAVRRAPTHVSSRSTQDVSLFSSSNSLWGKDQPMVLLLSAGIIILVVVGMYLSGWL